MTIALDSDAIREHLDPTTGIVDIALIESVDSTNDWCRRDFASGARPPFLRVAESQSAGKGRRGRTWVSRAGDDIIMSLVCRLDTPMSRLGCLSVAMGEAVAASLRDVGVQDVAIKWPNDVMVAGSKICGLLIESLYDGGAGATVIIGIGMNIEPVAEGVSPYPVTSVSEQIGSTVDRNRLIAGIVDAIDRGCQRMDEDPSGLCAELDEMLDSGQLVDIRYEDGSVITGIMRGMNDSGELKLEVDGALRFCNSADISLRRRETD